MYCCCIFRVLIFGVVSGRVIMIDILNIVEYDNIFSDWVSFFFLGIIYVIINVLRIMEICIICVIIMFYKYLYFI